MREGPHRGDIFWFDLPESEGSVQQGWHPVCVVSNDISNAFGSVVMPREGDAEPEHEPVREAKVAGDGNAQPPGEDALSDHPLIQGLFKMLPTHAPWPKDERDLWLRAAALNFDLIYGPGDETARPAANERERPSEQSPTVRSA